MIYSFVVNNCSFFFVHINPVYLIKLYFIIILFWYTTAYKKLDDKQKWRIKYILTYQICKILFCIFIIDKIFQEYNMDYA